MKFIAKLSVGLLLLIALFWAGLAVYFSYIDRNKSTFEKHLSAYFDRTVTIENLDTTWSGVSPKLIVEGFRIHPNETDVASPMTFESLEASLSLASIFRFWPEFTKFSVVKPSIEIVSIDANQISIGGVKLSFDGSSGRLKPKTIVRWLLDQSATKWTQGSIVWQRQSGERVTYKDISFDFQREQQNRSIVAGFTGEEDAIAFKAQSRGNLLSEKDWSASLEILDGQGQSLVTHEDFSLAVSNGQGAIRLKNLDVKIIQDFVALSGLAEKAKWLFESKIAGLLHDVELEFSGSLFSVTQWELNARASGFGFDSGGNGPVANKLAGEVSASATGGQFLFSAEDSAFQWKRWFDRPFTIKKASGNFTWRPITENEIEISLHGGQFDDGNSQIENINVESFIKSNKANINNIAQLFKVNSVSELEYENGKLVNAEDDQPVAININASANFKMADVVLFNQYLPKLDNLNLLKKWWGESFNSGKITKGHVNYQGPVSKEALNSGQAIFLLKSDFENVDLDYVANKGWPTITKGKGVFKIENQYFTLSSKEAIFGGDKIQDVTVTIPKLFSKNIVLGVEGRVTKSLAKVVDFIFSGPLIAEEKKLKTLPINVNKGSVDLSLKVQVPLKKANQTTVQGSGLIKNALVFLPSDVPLELANSRINFTEKSVQASRVGARFLGGQVIGDLVTLVEAQPPVFQVNMQGTAQTKQLKPWLGEHVLSIVDGVANWQGSLLVDNTLSLRAQSDLRGVEVLTPEPLAKKTNEAKPIELSMKFGSLPQLTMNYDEVLGVDMMAEKSSGTLFDKTLIRVVNKNTLKPLSVNSNLSSGVNFEINRDDINLDHWLDAIIELASFEPENINVGNKSGGVNFVDEMKSITLKANDPTLFSRKFQQMNLQLTSSDGARWNGEVNGTNIVGKLKLEPFENKYEFDLSKLFLVDAIEEQGQLPPIDYSLDSSSYPDMSLSVDEFIIGEKKLGQLRVSGKSKGAAWVLDKFEMQREGVLTTAQGKWLNSKELGSMTSFDFDTVIDQAETVLDDFSFHGFIKKGNGSVKGNLNWIGAPHEFDFSRLNGNFDLLVEKGELVKIEPGGGKILGLLNFNAAARRLSLDFSDVIAGGLVFDRMQYRGQLSEGKAIMQDAFILSPAAFIRMEGQVDIANEMIDMEVHMSPELGGNLALLSGLANPAAGALVFLTQRVFKEEIRDANFTSYRAKGTWEEFEIEQFKLSDQSRGTQEQEVLVSESLADEGLPANEKLQSPQPNTQE